MEIAAQDLKNPIMEGFLEKRRPSKRYLSVKYQKRWCVIHQDRFYYYESNTDKKPKGMFSLEGYTFFERENRLTFDLKCAGRRSFEFVCSSNAELKQWRKAIKSASLYRCGPTGKKKKVPDVPVPETPPLYQEEDDEIFADPNEIKKHIERKYSKENNTVRGPDETEVKQQLERSQSTENILDRRPVPSPRTSHRHKGHHHRRHDDPNGQSSKHQNEARNRQPMPAPAVYPSSYASSNKKSFDRDDIYASVNKGPQNLISNKQSFDDDDGYITVKKGPQKLTSSADDDSGYITVNKGPRTLIKHSDLVKEQSIQNSNSNAVSDNNDDNDNEALYLDLLGDNDLPNNNRSIEQNSTEELLQDPIYQNTNDPSLQYTTVLPKKMREVQLQSPYSTTNTNSDVISDSDEYTSSSEEESSDSELDDYENAQMFGLSQNVQ